VDILIHRPLEVSQSPDGTIVVEREDLHHHHAANVLDGINPELSVVDTRPTQASPTAELSVLLIASRDLKSKAEFIVTGTKRKSVRERRIGTWLQFD
jgi:hypothetical protein